MRGYERSSARIRSCLDVCAFNMDEIYFNEGIVGYYLGGFDLNTGDSDILLFEYLEKV